MRVDRDTLKRGFSEDRPEDGLQATFHPDGQLASLTLYREGQLVTELEVNPALISGQIRKADHFEAQLELPSSPSAQLVDWTLARVAEIEDAAAEILHCSFCTRHADEVSRLIEGPNLFICDECVGLCVAILSQEP